MLCLARTFSASPSTTSTRPSSPGWRSGRTCRRGTLARSLLSRALDEADADARYVVDVLDSIDGALERAQAGLPEARSGKTVALDDFSS